MGLRDHEPIVIEEFNGLWDRGDDETCPSDHFTVAHNIQFNESAVETRKGLLWWGPTGGIALRNIKRIHNYVMKNGQSLLVLTNEGKIYHLVGLSTVHGPIMTVPAMEDFNMVSIAGRAYITPFRNWTDDGNQIYQIGVQGESVWVYEGDGTAARRTGGAAPINDGSKPFIAYNDTLEGTVTKGIHLLFISFGASYSPGPVQMVDAPGNLKIQLTNLPANPGGGSITVAMTKAIDPKDLIIGTNFTYYNAGVIAAGSVDYKLDVPDSLLTVAVAPGTPVPTNAMIIQSAPVAGQCDIGFHIVAVVYETKSGFLSMPGPQYYAANTYVASRQAIRVYNIPVTNDPLVVKRHLISTKAIFGYNGDQNGYQFFFIPDGTINDNNVTTTKDVSYYDSDLVDDASHLLDNYTSVPAGVNLTTYHGRLVVTGISTVPDDVVFQTNRRSPKDSYRPDNRSVALLSAPGEPEAISKVDGLIIAPLDGFPLTNAHEFRDILYLFKRNRTFAYVDNLEEPAAWQEEVLDQGIGTHVHGIASVLDSGGVNTDFLIIVDWTGLMLFNGTYTRPELSFKIDDFWNVLDRNRFNQIQIANDSIGTKLYITVPAPYQNFVLHANYANGLNAKSIRWAKWVFDAPMSALCLFDTDKVIFGADEL